MGTYLGEWASSFPPHHYSNWALSHTSTPQTHPLFNTRPHTSPLLQCVRATCQSFTELKADNMHVP